MKKLNLNPKPSSLFATGIIILSLLVVLQARSCRGTAGHKARNMSKEIFDRDLQNKVDVSIDEDEKGRSQIFACVKAGNLDHIIAILDRFIKDMKSDFKHANPGFLNARDPIRGTTLLEEAIIRKSPEIIQVFLNCAYNIGDKTIKPIKIDTVHPSSGNTPLHYALETENKNIIKEVLQAVMQKNQDLLSAQNKDGNTVLHLAAAKHKLADIQEKLTEVLPQDKIWIKNNKGQDPVDIAMENNQTHLISFLPKAPLERLKEKNKYGQTRLQVAARLLLFNAFESIWQRIKAVDEGEAVKQLFEKDKKDKEGKSVWMHIIVSGLMRHFNYKANITMFEKVIKLVKDSLREKQWESILDHITHLENKFIMDKNRINKKYADELRGIVVKNARNNRNII
ncbi:ankyrin repeat domain-containing protein [Candidatus Cardinium sp. cByotN1]|uniref:ankyrin repeat domain-containing protein n=1 Tax=Candidatus Cardinium sp. cByotN1 TaxID=2699439 RepID=UPI001FB50080|nr:ankyrin repeat domain-containing protein [Candidatus Cardinium sp. cByotN1]